MKTLNSENVTGAWRPGSAVGGGTGACPVRRGAPAGCGLKPWSRMQDMHDFLDNFDKEFKFAGQKPHVLFAGRMEGDLMAGCGQNETSRSGTTGKACFPPFLRTLPRA